MSAGEPSSAGSWVARLASGSVQHRKVVLALYLGAIVLCAVIGQGLKFDALPDITNNQVLVLTRAPGLSPEEVERLVTRPIEVSLGGSPGLIEQRSLSRFGISAVTAVFADEVPPLSARQVTQERLAGLELPSGVGAPELGPQTGGLGEIFHLALTSPQRTPRELLELATYKVAPILRSVRGVVEVNTWGGQERVLEVRADPLRLRSRGLTLTDVQRDLAESMGAVAGTALPLGSSQALLRAMWRPSGPSELGAVLIGRAAMQDGSKPEMDGMPHEEGGPLTMHPVRVADIGDVREGAAPRLGAASRNGQGETVYLMAQMLRGENALQVMAGLHGRMAGGAREPAQRRGHRAGLRPQHAGHRHPAHRRQEPAGRRTCWWRRCCCCCWAACGRGCWWRWRFRCRWWGPRSAWC
jgi:cobalt-zinc-cadmium resistance protein CzcA